MTRTTAPLMRGLWWTGLVIIAIPLGAIGALIVLWLCDGEQYPIAHWVSGWLKSPGFAGFAAIIAASIAFFGIYLQLNANRKRDADSAWWKSFEWASDRGLPRDPRDSRLPIEATLDTLNALATAARTDIQKKAVGGVVDELLRSHEGVLHTPAAVALQPASEPHEQAEPGPVVEGLGRPEESVSQPEAEVDDSASAILRYFFMQLGTAAESRRANALAYEEEVLRALRHQYDEVTPARGSMSGDVIVRTNSRRLAIEIKWAHGATLDARRIAHPRLVDVLITNVPVANLPDRLKSIVWNPRTGKSGALRQALDKIE